ncbi:metallophosphoesterase [Cohnella massiliensis]|uniref:metallophosphoesterase n=1 Tax=Cohnella massiliensis TaxID=1816691 RepID=UPI0009BA2147|nr:metallophosphoesterase [Cohnella massiliensis]
MPRILAISDIHGHAEAARALLRMADYAPGTDRLYLLGDFIDTNRGSWPALRFARELALQGARAVLGNMERWMLGAAERKEATAVAPEDISFLRETPLYWREDEFLLVHAGIRPGVPLERQEASDLTGIRNDFWEKDGELPYTVVFGHTPTFKMGARAGELWFGKKRIGIDTGAKHGCRLTLVDLSNRISFSCATESFGRYSDLRERGWTLPQ